jgi:opacity protein-like surface antigen
MNKRNLLLASSALALLAGSGEAQAGNLYISVFGGANWLQDDSGAVLTNWGGEGTVDTLLFNSDADTGFLVGAAVGTHLDKWAKGLSVELEAGYRRNDLGGSWAAIVDGGEGFGGYTSTGPLDANVSTFSVVANLWYEVDVGWKVRPYLGGGVGWGRAHMDGALLTSDGSNTTTWFAFHSSGFVYQLGAGFNYDVSPGVAVGIGYRYFNGPNLDFYFSGKNSQPLRVDNDSHTALVNLTVEID